MSFTKPPTKIAEEIIKKSVTNAEQSSHYQVLPEHLLKELTPFLPLSDDEKSQILSDLTKKLNQIATTTAKITFSSSFANILTVSQKLSDEYKDKYVSVDHLILSSCQCISNIESLNKYKKDIESKVRNSKKPADTLNSDNKEASLPSFAVDMVKQAIEGKFDPVIGRDDEIRSVIEILSKKTKSNPILIGNPGVGKTAIVNAIAQMIANDLLPTLKGYKIYNIDIGSIIAGTGVRGEFEERFNKIVKEASNDPSVILFIDEIHMIINAGSCGGSVDAANMLKPALASGDIKCIGATTFYEYRKYIEKDPAFARRFVKVNTDEPNIDDSVTMLRGIRERIEAYHGTRILDQAIVSAVKMAKKYVPGRMLPDSAIDLVDTACASAVISVESEPQEALKIKGKIWSLGLEKASLNLDKKRKTEVQGDEYKTSVEIQSIDERLEAINKLTEELNQKLIPIEESHKDKRKHLDECKNLKQRIEGYNIKYNEAVRNRDEYKAAEIQHHILPTLQEKLTKMQASVATEINSNDIAYIVSRWTGIPSSRLTLEENERVLNLDKRIKEKIFGQDEAVEIVSDSLLTNRIGLSEPGRPIGTFLFLGPTGVGKTELAKQVCYEMFDDDKGVVIDMSDYSTEISVTKLIGVSAGYVGYDEGGRLTEPVKNKPYNLVLFDEIDLAHPSVFNILYQLLDEGRVVDGKGALIDFSNCIIIMTSNLGYKTLNNTNLSSGKDYKKEAERLAIEKFGPALFNRIDAVVHFNPLTFDSINEILDLQIRKINKRMEDRNIRIEIRDSARVKILNECTSIEFGARPLKKYLQRNIVNGMARLIAMKGEYLIRGVIEVNLDNEGEKIGEYFYSYMEV